MKKMRSVVISLLAVAALSIGVGAVNTIASASHVGTPRAVDVGPQSANPAR